MQSAGAAIRMLDSLLVDGIDLGSCQVEDYSDSGPLRKWKVTLNEEHGMNIWRSYPIIDLGGIKTHLREYVDTRTFIVQSVKGSTLEPGYYNAHADALGWSKVYVDEAGTTATYKNNSEFLTIWVKVVATATNGYFDYYVYDGGNFDPTTGSTTQQRYSGNFGADKWWDSCVGNAEGFWLVGYNGQNFQVFPVWDPINQRIGCQMSNGYTYGTWGNVNTSGSWYTTSGYPMIYTNNFLYPMMVYNVAYVKVEYMEHPIKGEEFVYATYTSSSNYDNPIGSYILGNHEFLKEHAENEDIIRIYPRKLKVRYKSLYEQAPSEVPAYYQPSGNRWDDLGIIEGYIVEEGQPLKDIKVELWKDTFDVTAKPTCERKVWTDENGYYIFMDVPANNFYSVTAQYPNDIHNSVIKDRVRPESYFNIERNASREVSDDNQSP